MSLFNIATVFELNDPGCKQFQLDCQQPALQGVLVHWQKHYYAYINRCPHTGIVLNWQPDVFFDIEEQHLQCSMHGAKFKPSNGLCVYGPCLGQSLSALDVEIKDECIYVACP